MKYRVTFDGKWQGDFEDLDDAMTWGREVADTGRLVQVVRSSLLRSELVAVLPEDQAEEGRRLWRNRGAGTTMPPAGP